jgi:hypothetical protein
MVSTVLDDLKFSIMSPLTEQVVALKVCGKCHRKILVERCSNEIGVWMQCAGCLTVYCLPTANPRAEQE